MEIVINFYAREPIWNSESNNYCVTGGATVVVKFIAALAASSRFSAALAAAVDRLKSATIKKYEATAAIVCVIEGMKLRQRFFHLFK
ncbi:hypothetical protein BLA29_000307 [Euroglyphus maynei]|uniref:Uncharacterized protein n=1 Tax=Euroglyphus maynei TaxID=6958 RepID=A0A1Y3AWZ5_EURMA|nr:hypothetical protein BLA29_000307 [Euroglyphus maynei]